MKKKFKFYSLDRILSKNCPYNLIIGERSNGKTYSVLQYSLKEYASTHKQLAIVRRWEEDFKGSNSMIMFEGLVHNKEVEKATNYEYNGIYYYSRKWYLAYYEDGVRTKTDDTPFAYGFALTKEEHYKSTSYPNIGNILFDEFITRDFYLPDEFVKFQNLLSTIIRLRTDIKIFMCANTVSKDCPYFREMGLKNLTKMQKGQIDIYEYGDSDLKVAVEYCDVGGQKKESNFYFAFDNPKLKMITNGEWEIDIYPHLPIKYTPKNVRYFYFIEYYDQILKCDIVFIKNITFTYITRKTTPIHEDDFKHLVFSTKTSPKPNYRKYINGASDDITSLILSYFKKDKVFYQDNDIGEVVRNYFQFCGINLN